MLDATSYCLNVFNEGRVSYGSLGEGVGTLQLVIAFLYLIGGFVIVFWIKRQEQLARDGDNQAVKSVIFPVFVLVLWANAIINMYIAIVFVIVPIPLHENLTVTSAALFSLMCFFQHFLIEGVLFLLLEKGMGMYSARQCLRRAFAWACFTFVARFVQFTSTDPMVGFGIYLIWNLMILLLYGAVWMLPRNKLFRRPAVIGYSIFWFYYRALSILAMMLQFFLYTVAAGDCVFAFGCVMGFALCEPLVMYTTLLRDCRWWQGLYMADNEPDTDTSLLDKSGHKQSELSASMGGRESERDSSMRNSNNGPGAVITSPLTGMDIKLDSAQVLADTLDQVSKESGVKLLNFAYIRLNTQKLLGQGSFSKVYKGKYKNMECAVKLIYTLDLTVDVIKRIAAEAELLSCMKHPNVVAIYGIATLPPSVCILLELCKYGSLGDVIRGKESHIVRNNEAVVVVSGMLHLSWCDLMHLALGCAKGIAALHRYQGVCHRDIKSFNFLVDGQLTAKVADLELGVGKSLVKGYRKQQRKEQEEVEWNRLKEWCCCGEPELEMERGSEVDKDTETVRESNNSKRTSVMAAHTNAEDILANWAPPEFIMNSTYTQASDIYSLGLVFWEIVGGDLPFGAFRDQHALRTKIMLGARPKMPRDCPEPFAKLIRSMWQSDPARRPSATDVVEKVARLWGDSCYSHLNPHIEHSDGMRGASSFFSAHSGDTTRSTSAFSNGHNEAARATYTSLASQVMGEAPHLQVEPGDSAQTNFEAMWRSLINSTPSTPITAPVTGSAVINAPVKIPSPPPGGGAAAAPAGPVSVDQSALMAAVSGTFPHAVLCHTSAFAKEFGVTAADNNSVLSMLSEDSNDTMGGGRTVSTYNAVSSLSRSFTLSTMSWGSNGSNSRSASSAAAATSVPKAASATEAAMAGNAFKQNPLEVVTQFVAALSAPVAFHTVLRMDIATNYATSALYSVHGFPVFCSSGPAAQKPTTPGVRSTAFPPPPNAELMRKTCPYLAALMPTSSAMSPFHIGRVVSVSSEDEDLNFGDDPMPAGATPIRSVAASPKSPLSSSGSLTTSGFMKSLANGSSGEDGSHQKQVTFLEYLACKQGSSSQTKAGSQQQRPFVMFLVFSELAQLPKVEKEMEVVDRSPEALARIDASVDLDSASSMV